MTKPALAVAMIVMLTAGTGSAARAEEPDHGKSEYQSGCAACHGIDGKGMGPVSSQLKVPPANLTLLAKNNGGVFPFDSVYATIDGRKAVAAHGPREMPIWGNRFGPEAIGELSVWSRITPSETRPFIDPETIIRLRILAVIDYLNRIQAK